MNTQKTYEPYHNLLNYTIDKIINLQSITSNLLLGSSQTAFNYYFSNNTNTILHFIEQQSFAHDHYYLVLNDLNHTIYNHNHLLRDLAANCLGNFMTNITIQGLNSLTSDYLFLKSCLGGVINSVTKYCITGNCDISDFLFGLLSSINVVTIEDNVNVSEENPLDPHWENYIMT